MRNPFKRARSIFDLRAAKPEKLEDLGAFVQQFGTARMMNRRNAAEVQRAIAQFIAIRTLLRLELP